MDEIDYIKLKVLRNGVKIYDFFLVHVVLLDKVTKGHKVQCRLLTRSFIESRRNSRSSLLIPTCKTEHMFIQY